MATPEQLKKMGITTAEYKPSSGVIPKDTMETKVNIPVQPDLSMNNPQYKALIDKGYTSEQISNAWAGIQAKQKPVKVEQPKQVEKPQVVSSTEVKSDTQKSQAEVTTTSEQNLGNWNYQDISDERQQQILNNLESAYMSNPQSFMDANKFKQTYNVGTGLRAKEQDQWINNWYEGKMAEVKKQNDLNKQLSIFRTMPTSELASITPEQSTMIFNSGDIDLYNKWIESKQAKQQLDLLNGTISYSDILGGDDLYDSNLYEDYKKEVTDVLSPMATEIADLKTKYENQKNAYDNILSDVTKQYEGTGATTSYINAMAAKKQREILPQLQQAQTEYNNQVALYNSQKGLLQEEFQLKQQDIENERAELSDKLTLFQNMFGTFTQRQSTTKTSTAGEKPLIENFGSTAKPNWKQYDYDTGTRIGVPGLGGAGGSTTTSSSKSIASSTLDVTQSNENLINTILASKSFTKEQKRDFINGINAGGDLRTIALNQAKSIMGTQEKADVVGAEKAVAQMKEVKRLLSEYYASGGKTGIFKGTMENVIKRLGEVRDEKLIGIASRIAIALQKYRNAISGTAYSNQEGQQIDAIFPGINKSEALNRTLLDSMIESFQLDVDNAYVGALGQGAYNQVKTLGQQVQQQSNTSKFVNKFSKYDKLVNVQLQQPKQQKQPTLPNLPIGGIKFGF